jgi:hypothetical protein
MLKVSHYLFPSQSEEQHLSRALHNPRFLTCWFATAHKVLFFASRSAKLHDPFRSTGCSKEGVEISVAREAHPS